MKILENYLKINDNQLGRWTPVFLWKEGRRPPHTETPVPVKGSGMVTSPLLSFPSHRQMEGDNHLSFQRER